MGKVIALSFGIFLLASCQTPSGSFCDIASPIRLTPAQVDSLTDEQVSRVLGHNQRGQRLCGWRP